MTGLFDRPRYTVVGTPLCGPKITECVFTMDLPPANGEEQSLTSPQRARNDENVSLVTATRRETRTNPQEHLLPLLVGGSEHTPVSEATAVGSRHTRRA
jgi:hypothetical protein